MDAKIFTQLLSDDDMFALVVEALDSYR